MNKRKVIFVLLTLVILFYASDAFAGPVTDVTNWLRDQFLALWNAFIQFMHDLVIFVIETSLELVRTILYALPPLDFLSGLTVCTILSNAGPWAKWAIVTFHLTEAFVLLSGALVFRLTRVVLTLFQWT
ncbi:hypothetical protein ACM9W9_10435 [Xanthomonas sacchari]